ncbi:MAG: hypothetical protein FJY85_09395 [Deltaproteobacteria bacterium]|nr:hypothetical protein [Deltaproteobacteria bacterium]
MNKADKAERMVRDMERTTPYMYEGLYGSFLGCYLDADKSKWCQDLSRYLSRTYQDSEDIGEEMADILWDRFERRISC